MKEVRWNLLKSDRLKQTRGVSFDEILSQGEVMEILDHPKQSHQKIMLFRLKGYIWVVPFIEEQDYYFLKTLYPSRKLTRLYQKGAGT